MTTWEEDRPHTQNTKLKDTIRTVGEDETLHMREETYRQ